MRGVMSQPSGFSSIQIHGFRVDCVTMDDALSLCEKFIAEGGPHHIVTADASMVMTARENSEFNEIAGKAALVTPDGAGILWASKKLGTPVPAKVSGVELSERLVALSGEKGWRVYFLGAGPGVAEAAAQKMREKYAGANIVGVRDGYFKADDEEAVIAEVSAAKPDILLVALGIPRQEKLIDRYKDRLGAKVLIGVGGTLDVFSGTVKRAPVWMQKVGLEWFWRVASNPNAARFKKLAVLPRFALLTLKSR